MNNTNAQNEPKEKISSLKKRLKYGSVAVAFIIIFIALIVIINIVTTAVHNKKPMIADMTKEQIFTLSDKAKELLSDVTAEIEIVFFQPFDVYENLQGEASKMIVNCAREFEAAFPNIKMIYRDSLKDPTVKEDYVTSSASDLKTTSVVVHSGNSSSIIAMTGFFTQDSETGNYIGFNGEKQIVAAILQVTSQDSPTVYFTTGHGETPYPALVSLFVQAGYQVKGIDLSTEDFDPEAKMLVISNPQKDFIGTVAENQTEKSEIEKVASFLNNFGNVMYFTSPSVGALPELDDLMKEWGVVFGHNMMVIDEKNAVNGSSGYALVSQYASADTSAGELHKSIRTNFSTLPKTIMYKAKPIQILGDLSDRTAYSVLTSYPTSSVYTSSEIAYTGSVPLMTLTQYTRYINNEPKTSFLLACGAADSLENVILGNSAYANSDVLLNAIRVMGKRKVAVDLTFKRFESFKLDMTIEQANNLTITSIIALPLVVIALGLVVWLRRRHS